MTDYTEADLDRDLGITRPSTTANRPRHRVGEGRDALLGDALGVGDVSEADRATAMAKLAEADTHPWRFEWPTSQALTRRGQEAELAELYTTRLGESQAVAEAHVHRVLSAAWTTSRDVHQQLGAVAEVLADEAARIRAKAPLTTPVRARETHAPAQPSMPARRGARQVVVTETSTARRWPRP